MTTAKNAGRVAGALILVQGIGGYVVNFGLIAPATAPTAPPMLEPAPWPTVLPTEWPM